MPYREDSTTDTLLKWAFWIGAGFATVQVFDKLTRKPALEMNPWRRNERLFQEALRRYVPGEPVGPLARELGVSEQTVIGWMKKAGVYESAPFASRDERLFQEALRRYVPGKYVGPLARKLGVSTNTITRWMKKAGVYESAPKGCPGPRDEQLFQEALRRYVPGEPVVPLAQELGVSKCTIINWMKDAGVYRPAPRGGPGRSRDEQLFQEALRRYVPGEPVGPLARELGVSKPTIINWMKDAGVFEPAPRGGPGRPRDEQLFQEALSRYVPGEPVSPLARDLGVATNTIIRWMKKARVYKPASEGASRDERLFQKALNLYVPGEPVGPVAEKVGVDPTTIIAWMKEAGRYKPAPVGRRKAR